MLKQRLLNGNGINHNKIENDIDITEEEEVTSFRISEWKAAALALCIALCVLTTKTVVSNREYLRTALWEKNYIYLESALPDGKLVGYYTEQISLKTKGIWIPLLSGILMTGFTWLIVYLDSSEPGVRPPTPFSPRKANSRKKPPGPTFHSGYLIAIANGVMVFILMMVNNLLNSQ